MYKVCKNGKEIEKVEQESLEETLAMYKSFGNVDILIDVAFKNILSFTITLSDDSKYLVICDAMRDFLPVKYGQLEYELGKLVDEHQFWWFEKFEND